jgi:tRNA-specific 2-thiouridylase
MKIAVGLSGGVDSSVCAALLKAQGHEVIGITMKIWKEGRYKGGTKDACFGPGEAEDIAKALDVCRELGIPHKVLDCSDEYEKIVLDDFRAGYLTGRTPNPCIRCNSLVKFGFLPRLALESGIVFERFATGHYARLAEAQGRFTLSKACDAKKDQSYFLYRLTQEQLGRLLLPLGNLLKTEVREVAGQYNLCTEAKPDSQDFYSGDYTELLEAQDRPGTIIDHTGRILGAHHGFWHFTIGQRKGLGIASPMPLYVTAVNPCTNEVVVGDCSERIKHHLVIRLCHWVSIAPPAEPFEASVKIRSASTPVLVKVQPAGEDAYRLESEDGFLAAAVGQSAVLYDHELLLGGGIIEEAV